MQPVTTNNVVTYVVILSAPNPEKKLMPGMTASATIYVEEKENALILSGKAMRFTPDAGISARRCLQKCKQAEHARQCQPGASSRLRSYNPAQDCQMPAGMPAGMSRECQ